MSPVKIEQKLLQWSFSRFKQYTNCPLSAKFKFIDKLEEVQSQAQSGGVSMHELACEWASKLTPQRRPSKMKVIPPELAAFAEEFEELRNSKLKVIVESECEPPWDYKKIFDQFAWGLTRSWQLTGFFAKDVWCRVKVDTHTWNDEKKTVRVLDYKSGRIYPDDHQKQLDLYALAGFVKYPEAEKVLAEMWYIDQQELKDTVYTRADIARLKKEWEKAVIPMLSDTRFAARPGRHCSWCSFSASKQGPCVH